MPFIEQLSATADHSTVLLERLSASACHTAGINQRDSNRLIRSLAAAGMKAGAGQDGRLTSEQLTQLLEGKGITERMQLKETLLRANLYPRGERIASTVPGFGY